MELYFEEIKKRLINNYDIIYRDIKAGSGFIHIVYCKNMCDREFVSFHIINPLLNNKGKCTNITYIKESIISSCTIGDISSVDEAITHILSGNTVIILGNSNQSLFCESKGFSTRGMEVPPTESVIKGPREGFNEDIEDSISAIRRRIASSDLTVKYMELGYKSKTPVAIIYIEGVAPKKLINYVEKKISEVQKDYMNYSNEIEEVLKDTKTPFDTIGYTEKPDLAVLKIEEGRVIVIVNGSPFVLIAPYFFIENFHVSDDYCLNKFITMVGRSLRYIAFFISLLLPGLYVALFTSHFSLVPYIFVFQLARSRVSVPFPLTIEVIIMIVFFQILREAGIRLPQPIGPALSIVGALILGEAAVKSGMASQATVLIIALTSISTFLIPGFFVASFLSSLIIITFASCLGLPGYFTAVVLFCAHLSGLTTCGYPYLYPLGTLKLFKYKDVIARGNLNDINQNIFKRDDNK